MVAAQSLSNSLDLTDADMVLMDVADRATDIQKRTNDLLSAADRVPAVILDEDTAGRAGAFVTQLTAHEKTVETRRKEEKGKFDAIATAVQSFFKPSIDSLGAAKTSINRRILAYRQEEERKAHEARRVAEEAARQARAEADRLAAAAQTDADLEGAIKSEAAAEQIQQQAAAIVAPPAQIRSSFGSVSSVRRSIAFKVVDVALVPRQYLMVNEAAIKAQSKLAAKGELPPAIPGIEWSWNEQMVSR